MGGGVGGRGARFVGERKMVPSMTGEGGGDEKK